MSCSFSVITLSRSQPSFALPRGLRSTSTRNGADPRGSDLLPAAPAPDIPAPPAQRGRQFSAHSAIHQWDVKVIRPDTGRTIHRPYQFHGRQQQVLHCRSTIQHPKTRRPSCCQIPTNRNGQWCISCHTGIGIPSRNLLQTFLIPYHYKMPGLFVFRAGRMHGTSQQETQRFFIDRFIRKLPDAPPRSYCFYYIQSIHLITPLHPHKPAG